MVSTAHKKWEGTNKDSTTVRFISDNKVTGNCDWTYRPDPYYPHPIVERRSTDYHPSQYNGTMYDFGQKPLDVPNKLDKELVDTKLPYNVKIDTDTDALVYEIAIAGYTADRVKLSQKKDGFLLQLLAKDEENDFIGERFEYKCRGLKEMNQDIEVYVNTEEYDVPSAVTSLKNGILTIMVSRLSNKLTKISIHDIEDDEQSIQLI